MTGSVRRNRRAATTAAGLAVVGALLTGSVVGVLPEAAAAPAASTVVGRAPHDDSLQKKIALYTTMRQLWTDHMQWTYSTVNAFFHNKAALQPTLDRLLRNQTDIGDAVAPYYGRAAGDKLSGLLTTHIKEAVPVLQAAQANNKKALDRALADWYANAKQIADFLTSANPKNWPASVTEPMLKAHISQTTVYSVDLLKGDYAKSIKDYDKAFDHMMGLSDTLSKGIVAQFPDKF
ncbi:hypothetical protein ACWCRD_01450 [Streptomyces sp. NPDC002092]